MATGPSNSSVTCLNCIVSSPCWSASLMSRRVRFELSRPYLIFRTALSMVGAEHLPAMDAGQHARQMETETLMSIFDLSGRIAVITGGNGGIGLGIAQALDAAGCNVSIWGRNADKNKTAAATHGRRPRQGRYPHLRRQRSRLGQGRDEGDARYISAGSTAALPMPASAAADGAPSSTAPRRNGARCSRPISTACSTCSRPPRAT